MTELIAGISGFVFRHEVDLSNSLDTLKGRHHIVIMCSDLIVTTCCICVCVCVQIKETFLTTYSDALMKYDGLDDRSLAVDGVQRRVSVSFSICINQITNSRCISHYVVSTLLCDTESVVCFTSLCFLLKLISCNPRLHLSATQNVMLIDFLATCGQKNCEHNILHVT